MASRPRRCAPLIALLVLFTAIPAAAEDENKIRCAAAFEGAQQHRRADELGASREQLLVCVETCPAALAKQCERWIEEVNTLMPTVRLVTRGAKGEPVGRGVRVFVDGRPLATDPSPDTAHRVEPGEHVFRFEADGHTPAEVRVALRGNDRGHEIAAVLVPSSPTPATVAEDKPPTREVAQAPSRVPAYVLLAAGGIAMATGGVLAIKGHLDRSDLRDSCAPDCAVGEVDAIRTTWVTAGVVAGVGAALVLVGWLFLPSTKSASAQRDVQRRLVITF